MRWSQHWNRTWDMGVFAVVSGARERLGSQSQRWQCPEGVGNEHEEEEGRRLRLELWGVGMAMAMCSGWVKQRCWEGGWEEVGGRLVWT